MRGVWAKARRDLAKACVRVSMHLGSGLSNLTDGTPHWHMLLFSAPAGRDHGARYSCYHARITDSRRTATPNALKARFHVEAIDPAVVSATGYIAKYISAKNIDGFALDGEQGRRNRRKTCRDMAKSVSAWLHAGAFASFQQIGGAPVTVW
ncbi:replication endonuclease [Salmonella enterica subsp. enterica]|nr:replication endonuclease [Salmonella enterica subsp. enterica]